MKALFRTICVLLLLVSPVRATVNTTTSSTVVMGTGSQTVFSFPFVGLSATNIVVIYTNSSGVQTVLTQGTGSTQYQVSINAAITGATLGVGGNITYLPSGTPIPVGSSLTIYRNVAYLQQVSLQNTASTTQLAKSTETGLDLLSLQIQQLATSINYSIQANPANTSAPAVLPPAAQAANYGLCFDSTGNNIIACASLPTGTVSSAMQPVVNAVSVAAAKTLLGIGAMGSENIGAGGSDDGSGNYRVNFTTVADATNQTVAAAFHLTQREATGGLTYTLPQTSTLWNGFGFWINALTAQVSVNIYSSDVVSGQSSGTGTNIYKNQSAFISTNGAGTWYVQIFGSANPTGQYSSLLSGSGTYTTPVTAVRLHIRMVGGGGGGGGIGTGTSGGTGGTGGTTTFGSFSAVGGSGGQQNSTALPQNGGAGGTGGTGAAFLRFAGGNGTSGAGQWAAGGIGPPGNMAGSGGSSLFGGAGAASIANGSLMNAATNTGSGGGGATSSASGVASGSGGGSGEFVEVFIVNPSSTYSYAVGAAGTAGTAGTSGQAGGAGGSGAIYIEALTN